MGSEACPRDQPRRWNAIVRAFNPDLRRTIE
jgi:hypothetical protein